MTRLAHRASPLLLGAGLLLSAAAMTDGAAASAPSRNDFSPDEARALAGRLGIVLGDACHEMLAASTIELGDDRRLLIIGAGRAGARIHAIDISRPGAEFLHWTVSQDSPGFELMGLALSRPVFAHLRIRGAITETIIVGGGYDANKDRSGVGSNDSFGRGVYVMRADTGELLWNPAGDGQDSIPSQLAVLDMNGDQLADRLVYGDTGGSLWRIDLDSDEPAHWQARQLARLGRHAASAMGKPDDRRFFHPPDVVRSADIHGAFDAVIIASGDQADLQDRNGTANDHLFLLRDRGRNGSAQAGIDFDELDGGKGGWKVELLSPAGPLKGLSAPLSIAGTIWQTSWRQTSGGTCLANGDTQLWALRLANGAPARNFNPADDLPAKPGRPHSHADRHRNLASRSLPVQVRYSGGSGVILPSGEIIAAGLHNPVERGWQLLE